MDLLRVGSRKAIKEWIEKTKLSTTPYNANRAHAEFSFIDKTWIPSIRADPEEREGGREGSGQDTAVDDPPAQPKRDPNTITFHLPPSQANTTQLPPPTQPSQLPRIKLLPPKAPEDKHEPESMRRKFCPTELRESVLVKIEAHRHAHPLIPGYSAPTPEGIYYWAVKQMHELLGACGPSGPSVLLLTIPSLRCAVRVESVRDQSSVD
ncbi:hypothetical protein GGU11DRAFT_761047 [Lentinula aff. detonsa]|nr:hypothetical protein GGU11DRAFT_761047 [Lentinula aff. detonsa]